MLLNDGSKSMQISNYDNCTGCGACANLCPRGCIQMKPDENGELHPLIDEKNCVGCKKCIVNCPANNKLTFNNPMRVYASWRKKSEEMRDSASGGVAAALSEIWIKQGGVVFGTKFDDSFHALICKEETLGGIEAFKGSKYVQSYAGDSYNEVKKLLKQGRKILYFGTPCQLAGLYAVVNRDAVNLITVEILCHGVSSNEYLQEQLKFIERDIHGIKYDNVTFRTNRWMMDFYFGLWNNDKVVFSQQAYENEYFRGFLTGLTLRESCYCCKYKSKERLGDILIGDFIGFGKHVSFNEPHPRPSLILVMNEKGMSLVQESKKELELVERTIEEALIEGRSLREPFPRHEKQKVFREIYRSKGFMEAIHESIGDEILECKKANTKMHIKRHIKVSLYKVLGIRIQGGKIYRGD